MTSLFTYGSLMFADIWLGLVRGHYDSEPAKLSGFQRVFIRGDRYPVLRPAGLLQAVEGVIYHRIERRDLNRLDDFEGEFYQRVAVMVVNQQQLKMPAEVYLLKPRYVYLASKRPWFAEHFASKLKQQFQRTYCKRN